MSGRLSGGLYGEGEGFGSFLAGEESDLNC